MAQFKTDLTLAELVVLITNSGLNIGLQYYVTDKDWLLYATSDSTLKPVSGSLHIFNGETLPTGIEPDVLLIDTGVVDWDISIGHELVISKIDGYLPKEIIVDGRNTTLFACYFYGYFSTEVNDYENVLYYLSVGVNTVFFEGEDIKFIGVGNGEGNYFRLILEFHRSELSYPIPVPHIVSAETDETGGIITLTFDSPIYELDWAYDGNPSINFNDSGIISSIELLNSNYKMQLTLLQLFNYGETILMDYIISGSSVDIKNTWGGLLAAVTDYPVVNNVAEPKT